MSFKYVSWKFKNSPYMNGNALLGDDQRRTVIANLLEKRRRQEIFETIQTYDLNGRIIHCPLYADFDGPTALDDCRKVITAIQDDYDVNPRVWFSGSKGFHLIVPVEISHEKGHKVAQEFFARFKELRSLDQQVYTGRRNWRLDGSVHHKTGLFKIGIGTEELFYLTIEDIREYAKEPLESAPIEYFDDADHDDLFNDIELAIKRVDNRAHTTSDYESNDSWTNNLTPCIERLLDDPLTEGERNTTATLLARFFNSYDATLDEALDEVLSRPHWREYQKELEKVFKCVFRAPSRFGCRNVELLERHCDRWCHFSKMEIENV